MYLHAHSCVSGTLHCDTHCPRTGRNPSGNGAEVLSSASQTWVHTRRGGEAASASGAAAERPRASRRPADRDWSVTARRSLGRRASRTNILLARALHLRF
ncbi:hypothetical protein SFRURICE_018039 [Spodoptera frugiperda]|nr:hypothetical protein SFRURICE_018039 [Spodoptera frugiperda]